MPADSMMGASWVVILTLCFPGVSFRNVSPLLHCITQYRDLGYESIMSWLWGRNEGWWRLQTAVPRRGQTPKQNRQAYLKLACIFRGLGVMPDVTDFQTLVLHPN